MSPSSFQVSAYAGTPTNELYPATYPREIIELGRALGTGRTEAEKTDIVYRYVRDNIKIAWMFGLQKGALGAIVDRSGTSFDQAYLMGETLRQQGVTPVYQFGTITLTGAQFEAWSGVSDARAACQLLAAGGIPASINGSTIANCGYAPSTSISTITLAHVWVKVTLGGTPYVFDPAYKPHTLKAQAVSLAGIIAPGQPMAAAANGMESVATGVPYVRNLNGAGLDAHLASYAGSVQAIIEGSFATGEVEDVVGGSVVQRSDPTQSLRQTSLPYSSTVLDTWADGIPDKYRTTLDIKVERRNTSNVMTQILQREVFVDEIYGRKIAVIARDQPQISGTQADHLRVVDELGRVVGELATHPSNDAPSWNFGAKITLKVNHPYPDVGGGPGAYMDDETVKVVDMWMPLTIVAGFGDVGRGLVDKWGARDDSEAPPLDFESGSCGATDTCGIYAQSSGDGRREQLAASWLVQSTRASQIHAALAGAIWTHHHSIGVVAADSRIQTVVLNPAQPTQVGHLSSDSFDRVDINTNFSVTSRAANAVARRVSVQAIAQTLELLEGSVAAQIGDLPDTTSVATRFAWGNSPPPNDDNKVTTSPGARRFYSFAAYSIPSNFTVFEGSTTPPTGNGSDTKFAEPNLTSGEADGWRLRLETAAAAYTQAGFQVVTSEEAFLGPGQRGGAQQKQGSTQNYSHLETFQRGGALSATKYDENGDPLEIAHVTVGPKGLGGVAKGGGGGAQSGHAAQYNPSKAADVLKARFVDRSSAVGVDLLNGNVTYSSPAGLEIGAGEFPDKLSLQVFWRGGETKGFFRPPGVTEPQTPWSTNWHNTLTNSGSGMEAMGATDVRATGGTIAAFLAMQDVYKSAPSAQRDVTAALVGAWWADQLTFNVVTVNVGSGTQQFVRRYDRTFFAPGPGRHAALTQVRIGPEPTTLLDRWDNKGRRRIIKGCDNEVPFSQTRGWDYSTIGFVVRNAGGDEQTFSHWANTVKEAGYCARHTGFRLMAWTFPKGVTINLRYESAATQLDRLAEVSNTLGRHIDFIYQPGGVLTGFSDRTRTMSMSIDAYGSATFTDAAGKVTTAQANFVGGWTGFASLSGARYQLNDVFAADAPSGPAALHYDYDTLGRVKEAKDRLSLLNSTLRPAHQFLIGHGLRGERIDPAGGRYAVDYNEDKQALRFVDEIGRATTATYDGRGRTTSYTYPEGDREEMEYDARNNQTVMRKLPKPGSAEATANQKIEILASWDPTFNKIATLTDAKGQVSGFNYFPSGNGKGEMAYAVRPNGATYAFVYNSLGQLTLATDPTGVKAQIDYDPTSKYPTVTTLDPGGVNAVTTATYNTVGDPTQINGPRTDVSDISYVVYDNLRRKTLEVQPYVNGAGAATQTVYNNVGWVTSVSQGQATGTAPAFAFTPVVTTTNEYDAVGNKTKVSTPVTVTEISYDRLNRTDCTATRMNGAAADPCLLSVQGAFGPDQISKNLYDLAGQLLNTRMGVGTDAETTFVTKEYTPNGQAQFVIDGNCNVTKLEYDGFDRLKKQSFPQAAVRGAGCVAPGNAPGHAGAFSLTDVESYGYDLNGNRTNLTKRDGTQIVFGFDNIDRKTQQIVNGESARDDAFFAYDLADRMTSARRRDTQGVAPRGIFYEYDTAGRLVKDKAYFWAQTVYTLDTAGNRTKITWPDGGIADFVYDAANRMSEIRQPGQAAALITFTYDAMGRRTGLGRSNGASAAYQYADQAGRLTKVSQIGSNNTLPSIQAISYTPASQIRTLAQDTLAYVWQGQPLATKNLSHDGLNRDATISVLPNGYDKNGNVRDSGLRSYDYDADNRVILESDGTNSMGLAYDPLGRLRATQTSAGVWTYFLYAGDQLIGEYELKTDGAPALRRYVHGPGVDEPLIWYQRNGQGVEQANWLHADRQGSIIGVSNASGVVTPYNYGPYGEPNDWAGPRFRYTGQAALPEMQAYYYKARIYDPAMGRFLQTDPIGQEDDPNLYAYVQGDPANATDPTGLMLDKEVTGSKVGGGGSSVTSEAGPGVANASRPAAAAPGGRISAGQECLRGCHGVSTASDARYATKEESDKIAAVANTVSSVILGGRGSGGRAGASRPGQVPPATAPVGRRAPNFEGANRQLKAPAGAPRNAPGEVGGRQYSGHAFDRMQDRGLTPRVVEDTIRTGIPRPSGGGTTTYTSPTNNVGVLVDNVTGRVITTY